MAALETNQNTRLLLLTLPLAIVIGCLSPIAIAVPASENAALRYWRVWSYIDTTSDRNNFHLVSVYDGDYDPEFNHADEDQPVVTSRDLLDRLDPFIEGLIEATEFPACDFGVDYDKGVEALLPHLSTMRKSAQLLVLDAKRLISEGDVDAATERLAAAMRLADHVTGDETFINALVSVACFALVEGEIERHADVFTAENRKTLHAALLRFNPEDPFGCVQAVRAEAQIFGGWMLKRIDREWATPESFAADVEMLMGGPSDEDIVREVYQGDIDDHQSFRRDIRSQLDQYVTVMHLLAEAWNTPEAEKSLEAIDEKIADGSFGPLARLMAPALTRSHKSDMKMRTALAARLEWASN